ncbi:MAG: type transport system permease protein [Thermoleophilales bacterium]|nr:type transport system permease protein [Thermoleophilales bacterium]
MRGAITVVRYALQESLRRRVFVVVLLLTVAFLGLFWLAAREAFKDTSGFATGAENVVDTKAFTGATMFGLAMFTTLFLGVVLVTFLTPSVVRGDAERGLLQPLVVRPLGRATLLLARWAGASGVAALYVIGVYAAALLITRQASHGWTPDHIAGPAFGLAGGVAVVAALSLLGSIFLSTTANGIAIFMLFGAGLTAGLLGAIGHALSNHTLEDVARVTSWLLPFEALYQAGLHALISDTTGLTGVILQLGPFGVAQNASLAIVPWTLGYLALVLAGAVAAFARRDL